jgi:hypothetical protein
VIETPLFEKTGHYDSLVLICVGIQIFLHERVIVPGTNDRSSKFTTLRR